MTPNGWFIACSQRSLLSLDFLLFFQSYVDYKRDLAQALVPIARLSLE